MQFTKETIALAKDSIKAIEFLTKRTGEECPECKGLGKFPLSKERIVAAPRYTHIKCPKCNGTGKIARKWKWEPEPGELFLRPFKIKSQGKPDMVLIYMNGWIKFWNGEIRDDAIQLQSVLASTCIPILEWQQIKRILEGMGYIVKVRDNEGFGEECKYNCGIYKDRLGVGASAPTYQEAVQLAIIELRKKVEK